MASRAPSSGAWAPWRTPELVQEVLGSTWALALEALGFTWEFEPGAPLSAEPRLSSLGPLEQPHPQPPPQPPPPPPPQPQAHLPP